MAKKPIPVRDAIPEPSSRGGYLARGLGACIGLAHQEAEARESRQSD
jgi:hypothetical protein